MRAFWKCGEIVTFKRHIYHFVGRAPDRLRVTYLSTVSLVCTSNTLYASSNLGYMETGDLLVSHHTLLLEAEWKGCVLFH